MRLVCSLPLIVLATPALAQTLPLPEEEAELGMDRPAGSNEILVIADRFGGQLDVPQEPIATFDEADIQALGASSVAELLTAISPQTGTGRGRGDGHPVVLVNGQRIASFREMRNYPPEAVKRMEVLPEEVALRLGYPANARVVNMILKDDYASRRVELDYGLPSRGGFAEWEAEGSHLRIKGASRLNLSVSAEDRSALLESERKALQPADPASAPFRSLVSDAREFGLNASWTRGLGKDGLDGSVSLNASLTREDSHAYSGLDPVSRGVLDRIERIDALQGGLGFIRGFGNWQLTATVDAAHRESTERNEQANGLGQFDTAKSTSDTATSLATLIGRPVRLPAGEVPLTIKAGYAWSAIKSSDTGSAPVPVTLRRGDLSAGVSVSLPIASRRENVLAGLGDVSLDLSAGYNHLSDFGSLSDWSAGLSWSPTGRLGLQASYFVNQAAPSLTQLGNPQTQVFNVPVYDFARGETVLVTVTTGGNPALRKEEQRDWKFGATWGVPFLPSATLVAEYFRNRSDNVTAAFPLLTPAIEAAFPGRATRDLAGRLTGLDMRPVTFAAQSASRLRWGLSLSDTIGKAPPGGGPRGPGPGAGPGGPRPPGGGGLGGPGGGGRGRMMAMMMGGGGQGRWSLGAYHTVQFTSRVLVAPGGPLLDLLDGDALSTTGTPRHGLEFNGGLFRRGKGLFFQGTWTAPTRLEASGLPGTSDLRFGALTKVSANFFVELGEQGKLAEKSPFFKGLRLSLRFENLLDSRQKVTDETGRVPVSYQKDYLDPRGRVIEFELRKMF